MLIDNKLAEQVVNEGIDNADRDDFPFLEATGRGEIDVPVDVVGGVPVGTEEVGSPLLPDHDPFHGLADMFLGLLVADLGLKFHEFVFAPFFDLLLDLAGERISRGPLLAGIKEAAHLVEFDKMGCFLYSREEGTAAYSLPGQVEEKVKERRKDELMKLQAKISYKKAKEHVGETMEGIVVGKQGGSYLLRSYWNAPDDIDGNVYFSSPRCLKEGEIVSVRIVDALVYDLLGELVID